MVYHQPDKFGDHRHCDSGDMFIICQLTLQNHKFKILCDYGWKALTASHHFAMFRGHWSSRREDIKYIIYQLASQNYEIIRSRNLLSRSSSLHVITLPNLIAKDIIDLEV